MKQQKPAPGAGAKAFVTADLSDALAAFLPVPRVRSTVFNVLRNHGGLYGVGLHNTPARDWGFTQGLIEVTDIDEVEAGYREAFEELGIQRDDVDLLIPSTFGGRLTGCRDTRFDESDYVGHLMVLKPEVVVSELTYTEPAQPFLEWRWGTHDEVCTLLIEQPDLSPDLEPADAQRLREKGRKIYCPALHAADELLSMYGILARLDDSAAPL